MMNENNSRLAHDVLARIADFKAGQISLDEMQAILYGTASAFENDQSDLAATLRLAEADLEEIQFASMLSEHRRLALHRLATVCEKIEAALVPGS